MLVFIKPLCFAVIEEQRESRLIVPIFFARTFRVRLHFPNVAASYHRFSQVFLPLPYLNREMGLISTVAPKLRIR